MTRHRGTPIAPSTPAAPTPEGSRVASRGDIVAVPPVREARHAGRLKASPMFEGLDRDGAVWADGTRTRR